MAEQQGQAPSTPNLEATDNSRLAQVVTSERYMHYRLGPAAARSEADKWQNVMNNLDRFHKGDGPIPIKLYQAAPDSLHNDYSYIGRDNLEVTEAHDFDTIEHRSKAPVSWGYGAKKEYEKALNFPDKLTTAERQKAANLLARDVNREFMLDANNQLGRTRSEIIRTALYPGGYKNADEFIAQENEAIAYMKITKDDVDAAIIISNLADRELYLKTTKAQKELNMAWDKVEATSEQRYTGDFIRTHRHVLDEIEGAPTSAPKNPAPLNVRARKN